jgi:RNA polymerase sigma factor (sigma-70 family)
VESAAIHTVGVAGLRGPSPFLRLQSDERLVGLTRRGNQGAYEVLVARYDARLLSFTRHMLGSKEDAEDVVQETFAAAYNAMLADERPINVKPWLYRIARNRSLNHLRRHSAIGVETFDHHVAEHGATTADKVHKREEFRQLMEDVQGLPETQRTALLLREIDALSYDQIAEAMETTVPSVKSLLVRARVSLGEAAEARKLSCEEVREELGEVAEGLRRLSPPVRRHLRECDRCAEFRKTLRDNNKALALMLPIGPLLLLKKLALAQMGTTASAGGGAAATAATGATVSAAAGSTAGGAISAGVSAIATKAATVATAAAIVTAGAVEVDRVSTTTAVKEPATIVAQAPARPAPAPAPAPAAKAEEKPAAEVAAKPAEPAPDAAATVPAEPVPAPPATVPAEPAPAPVPADPAPPVDGPQEQVDAVTLPAVPPADDLSVTVPPTTTEPTPPPVTLPAEPEGITPPAEPTPSDPITLPAEPTAPTEPVPAP